MLLFLFLLGPGWVWSQDSVRVVTLNLWHGSRQLEERTLAAQRLLAHWRPDIVGLQEVSGSLWRANRAKVLARALDYHYAYHLSDGTRLVFAEGLAVMSRHPVKKVDRCRLVHSKAWPFERRFVQWAEVRLPSGQPLILLNTHLTHHEGEEFEVKRLEQALQVIEVAARVALARDIPAILVGDLNALDSHMAVQALSGRLLGSEPPFGDAWTRAGAGPGLTVTLENPFTPEDEQPGRLDYVKVLRGTTLEPEPVRAWLIADGQARTPVSDHYGVAVDVRLRPARPGRAERGAMNPALRAEGLLAQVAAVREGMTRAREETGPGKMEEQAEGRDHRVLQWLEARVREQNGEGRLAAVGR